MKIYKYKDFAIPFHPNGLRPVMVNDKVPGYFHQLSTTEGEHIYLKAIIENMEGQLRSPEIYQVQFVDVHKDTEVVEVFSGFKQK